MKKAAPEGAACLFPQQIVEDRLGLPTRLHAGYLYDKVPTI